MTNEFTREERYIVFKISDVVEHLTTTEALHLARLYEIQRVGRKEAGKSELECIVVEKDWPEYEPTWQAIEARVTGAQPAPSVPDCLTPLESIQYWADAYANPKGDAHFIGHGVVARLLREYADLRAMLAAAPEAKP